MPGRVNEDGGDWRGRWAKDPGKTGEGGGGRMFALTRLARRVLGQGDGWNMYGYICE